MNTTKEIQDTVAAINSLLPAVSHLRPEVHGITHGLSEYFLVQDVNGDTAAVGYSEAELLGNLHRMAAPVTAWTRWYPPEKSKGEKPGKPGYWEFNHIEDGHATSDTPADPFSRGWCRATWQREYGYLVQQAGGSPVMVRNAEGGAQ